MASRYQPVMFYATRHLGSVILLLLLSVPSVFAACSNYSGRASLNEVNSKGNSGYVEINLLDASISQSIWRTWSIRLCDSGGCYSTSLNSATNNSPWLVRSNSTIDNYIDFKNGSDILLIDAGGNTIDYLSINGYTNQQDSSCSLPFDTTITGTSSSTQTAARIPDGTGDWLQPGSGNSVKPTQGGSNDTAPGGATPTTISVNNVTVAKGQLASFTFNIPASVSYDITVSYQTLDNTAVAGTDYTANSGVATIVAGTTTTTVNVATNPASSSGEVSFYLYLYNQQNATLTNHYPLGTILGNPLAAWYMSESSWNGTGGEVNDSSGNADNGTAMNGAQTASATPAIVGSPGTCGYGSFDGNNDYIALPNFPNLTGSFTITAWIRPNRINGDQRIFADDENNTNGYAFSLGDGGNGKLRFFSRKLSPVSLDSSAVINSTGVWYHVAVVHNATLHTREIFVNGVSVTGGPRTYSGSWGTDPGTASIGGETNNAGSEAVAKWRFNGAIDEVRVYSSALDANAITSIMSLTHNCVALDHLQIEHDGTALTCQPETVTVRSCADSACTTEYTGNVTVTLTPTGWTGGDTQSVIGGHSSFVLPHTSPGAVTLGISTPSPYPGNGVRCLNTATGINDCTLTYYDSGFIYSVPNQTSCTTSNAITISAVRLSSTSQQCVPTFVSQTRNLNFSLAYSNPTTGTKTVSLNYNSTNYNVNSTGVSVPITFNGSGQASFTLSYPDAGQIAVNSQYLGSTATGNAGLVMNGSASFVTAPAKLYVYSDDANSDCASASPSCSAFVRAGAPFTLKIRGACADNSVTPNFQLNGLTLSHLNVAPAISQGNLAVNSFAVTATDNGEHVISNQSVSEVGAFTFTAALPAGGYFGDIIGTTALNTSAIIGRFYPSHFCATPGTFTNRTDPNTATGCTDNFSYLDEEFTLATTLTAQAYGTACNATGITRNYSGAWSQFTSPFVENTSIGNETGKWNYAAVNNPGTAPIDLSGRVLINTTTSSGSFNNGQASLTTHMKLSRAGSAPTYTADTPFGNVHIGINPIDNDNVSLNTTNLTIGSQTYLDTGTTALYFGRLQADNAYGTNDPKTPLDMYAHSQYCTAVSAGKCTDWQTKSDDSCSLYNVSPPTDTALGLAAANDGLGGYYQRASATVSSSSFNFDATGAAPGYARVHVPDTSGHSAGWRLFYTGSGNGGDYTIPFSFPFNSNPSEHPYLLHLNGVASFGQFRGDDRIIYWREILE